MSSDSVEQPRLTSERCIGKVSVSLSTYVEEFHLRTILLLQVLRTYEHRPNLRE